MFTLPLAELGSSLGLKRRGKSWNGPCPYCGGRDRFFIGPGKQHDIVFGCRNCGKDTGGIIRELVNLGLWQDDQEKSVVIQRRYNSNDIMYVDAFLLMYKNGQQPTEQDLAAVQSRINLVDPMRQMAIKKMIRLETNHADQG